MKLRFRLSTKDKESRSLAQIHVRLVANIKGAEFILDEVATNAMGYGIVTVPKIKEEEIGLRISGDWVQEIAPFMIHPNYPIEIAVPQEAAAQSSTHNTLPWHSEPLDLNDIAVISSAFSDLGQGSVGEGYCGRILPSDRGPEFSQFTQIRRTSVDGFECKEGGIFLTGGEAMTYEVKHSFLGLSLGTLLKSTSLLPCEKVTIAVRNWQNRTQQQFSQSGQSSQQQNQTLDDAQSLNEMVQQSARSFSAGLKVNAAVEVKGVPLGIGLGAGISNSQADASIRQDLTRSMRATASAYRSERRVSISEVNQAFSQQDSVRSFCNNNHCHTLNVFWRQVNENFKTEVTMLGTQKVVFWPQEVSDFPPDLIACKRHLLEGNLLDSGLEACWDGFSRDQAKPVPIEAAPTSSGGGGNMISKLELSVDIGGDGLDKRHDVYVIVKMKDGTGEQRHLIVRSVRWDRKTSYTHTISLSPAIAPTDIASISLFNSSSFGVDIDFVEVSIQDDGPQKIVSSAFAGEPRLRDKDTETFDVNYTRASETPTVPPAPPVIDEGAEQDALCAARLQHHINCNAHYYSQLLWLGVDIEERRCMFEKITCRGRPLTDFIDPTPVGLWGCNLVFARADAPFEDAPDPQTSAELITLPTDGVYADSALGQCSSCETITEGEFRDWEPGHCGCSEPALIAGTPDPADLASGTLGDWAELNDLIGDVPGATSASSVLAGALGKLVEQNNAILETLLAALDVDPPEPREKGSENEKEPRRPPRHE